MGPYKRHLWHQRKQVCYYCKCALTYDEATVDHVIPRAEGGTHYHTNLVLCCDTCNQNKANLSEAEYLKDMNQIKATQGPELTSWKDEIATI